MSAPLPIGLAATLLVAVTSVGVAAQPGWLERGSALLQGLGDGGTASGLASDELTAGLKEALRVGAMTVVSQLGARDGFDADPAIRIPLPDTLQRVRNALTPFGLGGMLDDLERRLNRAAEDAIPGARALFMDAIGAMTLDDARQIIDGPDDAATRYFQARMSAPLAREWRPIVDASLAEVGAMRAYDAALGEYARVPFVPDARANLGEYVIEKALGGVFHYLAREEAAIRNEPLKRSTELLRRVFGPR